MVGANYPIARRTNGLDSFTYAPRNAYGALVARVLTKIQIRLLPATYMEMFSIPVPGS